MMELEKKKEMGKSGKLEKAKGSKKTKKREKKEHEDDNVLKGGSEKLVVSKRKHEPEKVNKVLLDGAISKHHERQKHKKTKNKDRIDDHKSEGKRRKKEGKAKCNEPEESKDEGKEFEESHVKKLKKDKKYKDEFSRKKQHKAKKKCSKQIGPDGICEEVKSEDLDTKTSKHAIGRDVGQWGSASFDTVEQKNKFIRLLGGYKNKHKETNDTQLLSGLKKFNSAAMNKNEEENLNKKLETQYQQAFDTSRKRRGFGLGYDASQDTNVKKFHIDVEQTSKSIKFE